MMGVCLKHGANKALALSIECTTSHSYCLVYFVCVWGRGAGRDPHHRRGGIGTIVCQNFRLRKLVHRVTILSHPITVTRR